MKLYSGPISLFSRKVEIALGEKGIAFEREMVPFTQARGYAPKHPAILAANPKGQVPVLVDGDLTIFDSTLILEYLEDAYPDPPLYPREPRARARCRLRELYADEVMLPPVRTLMHRSVPPEGDDAARAAREDEARRGEGRLRAIHAELEEALGDDEFLCGPYGAADIATFMMVFWARRLKGPALDAHPALARWYDRVARRPAVARVIAELLAADRELSPHLYRA